MQRMYVLLIMATLVHAIKGLHIKEEIIKTNSPVATFLIHFIK